MSRRKRTETRRLPTHPAEEQPTPGEKILILLPTLLLVIVATVQFVRGKTANLSSWKGGGFGMFASLDHLRFTRTFLVDETYMDPYMRPPIFHSLWQRRAETLPSTAQLYRYATSVHTYLHNEPEAIEVFGPSAWPAVRVIVYDVQLQSSKPLLKAVELGQVTKK